MTDTLPIIASVAVAAPLPHPLSYLVPLHLHERVRAGSRVIVPLGRRQAAGCVLSVTPGDSSGLKELVDAPDDDILFPETMLPFLLRAAEYYRYPPGEAIRSVLPAGLGTQTVRVTPRTERVFTAIARDDLPRGAQQLAVITLLRQKGPLSSSELRKELTVGSDVLRRLIDSGWLEEERRVRRRDPFLDIPAPADRAPTLNAEQEQARTALHTALHSGIFAPFLLHGVTGSGKTEVYLHAIADALALGKQALILVPEIALTPQLTARFRARFGASTAIAVLHSGLSDGERFDAWRMISCGEAQIVIGARSAIFAPLTCPGVIVVDEEHDSSYKQGEGFRYNARDLALLRGQMDNATVILGSATPAVTTFHRAQSGLCGYLPLTGRAIGQPMPRVEIVDLRQQPKGTTIIAPPLQGAIAAELAVGGQILLLLNRRGFAPAILCRDCGTGFHCPNCDIALTFHARRRRLLCHYCDYNITIPSLCPTCNSLNLEAVGAGTERLEEELQTAFPAARIGRMDRDTTGGKGAHRQIVDAMLARQTDILVGTQMIAKGHDFPGVTLVGVINADLALNLPDFRAAERAFTLLSQVAGRAGRGDQPGRVLIQTYAPEHYAVTCALQHDYQTFYTQEITFRQELGYPPFGHLINLVLSGNDGALVADGAEKLSAALRGSAGKVEILGPAPCPLSRLRGKHRFQLLLKNQERTPLRRLLGQIDLLRRKVAAGLTLSVDIDPLDML
ncbi:MAG: primosomal protein N' [Desulfuromonadales bacterium]|nr:primosomal protein N' [Desulfuromonadales bacterium]